MTNFYYGFDSMELLMGSNATTAVQEVGVVDKGGILLRGLVDEWVL